VLSVRAEQIMSRSLICAEPQQDLAEVEQLFVERHIGGVPVVEHGRLVGVLSRGDIARVEVLMNSLDGQITDELRWDDQADGFQHAPRAEFQGFRKMIGGLKVRDAMHDQVVTCTPATIAADIAEAMVRHHVHRVIVVDGDRPVGIVSSLDLIKLMASSDAPRS
jgi:CBS domain-containing protein